MAEIRMTSGNFFIAGPCSVESEEQIKRIASKLSSYGIKYLRGGAFKSRTSPDSFQGLGFRGLEFLKKAADIFGMKTVSEITDPSQLEKAYDLVDIVQIGSRSMTSYELLKQIGKITSKDKKAILLKRGLSSTLSELILSAKYISDAGNDNIILCLRGIRTFEQIDSELRFTPDLAGILELKNKTDYPVIFDPSHTAGNSAYVEKIALAAVSLEADGLLIECHDKPEEALSDGFQAILPEKVGELFKRL